MFVRSFVNSWAIWIETLNICFALGGEKTRENSKGRIKSNKFHFKSGSLPARVSKSTIWIQLNQPIDCDNWSEWWFNLNQFEFNHTQTNRSVQKQILPSRVQIIELEPFSELELLAFQSSFLFCWSPSSAPKCTMGNMISCKGSTWIPRTSSILRKES